MDYKFLQDYKFNELKKLCHDMELKSRRSRDHMILDISKGFAEYEEYKNKKVDKYTRVKQLGQKGKEGVTYLVTDKNGEEFAMKTFRKSKSSNTLKKEYYLQKQSSKFGIAPKVVEYDTVSKYIVMEVMEQSLVDVMSKQKGNLLKHQQHQILDLYKKLDNALVFHGDANISNYMFKGKQLYMIDYGFSKEITPLLKKKLNTETPNQDIMLIGFILKLKELRCPESSYKYLIQRIKPDQREKFNLD
jgi:predicted Ser/Thr protein kinase